jgi:multiple sugar transport system ATP-binding protein
MATFEVNEENTMHGIVNLIEPTSSGSTVYLTSTDDAAPQDFVATFTVRVPASYLDQQIPLAIDTSKIHLFDVDTGASLLRDVPRNGS